MHASYPMRDDALLGCYWELSKVTGSATGAASTNRLSIHPNETIATLRTEKDDLEETVGTLLEQLARQDEKLEAANRRADGFHSIEEELGRPNVDDVGFPA